MARLFDMIDMKKMGRFQNLFPGPGDNKAGKVFRREGVLAANDAAMIARMEKNNRLQALRLAKQEGETAASAIANMPRRAKKAGHAAAR